MIMQQANEQAPFSKMTDLASARVGGKAIRANDEFFAPKENLLKAGRGVFIPDKYTERGKWMDGWETRRKRVAGYDWCIIKLGIPGVIRGVDIDTNYFLGNHPPFASIEACAGTGASLRSAQWTEILSKSSLGPGSQNIYPIKNEGRWTHIRLNIYPDGGVARLRVFGEAAPDWKKLKQKALVDLAAVELGGRIEATSDRFFGSPENLLMPGRALTMGDGWETKRRRGPGYDWAVIRLGHAGTIAKIEVDTNHFKGNFPDTCSIDACLAPGGTIDPANIDALPWKELLKQTKLQAHKRHLFTTQLKKCGSVTHVRLNIFPDGGVSRLRVWGKID
jgi:allantoicase